MSALTDEEIAEGWTENEWVYLGRRFSAGDKKLWFNFRDHDGETRLFSRPPRSPVIGGRYAVQNRTLPEGRCSARVQDARYVGPVAEPDHAIELWRLTDRSAATQLEALRARKRAAADNGEIGNLTLADVRALVVRQATSTARAGMIAAVLNYIERG
jgi:hypothetical protein